MKDDKIPKVQAIRNIENKNYGVTNIASIIKAVLIIISTVYAIVGLKLTWWSFVTSPIKTYTMIKVIIREVGVIMDNHNTAWEEIKDFKANEIDDLLREMLDGFKQVFG